MDLKQIKELIAAMEKAGIKKLTIKQKSGDEVHLERQEEHPPPAAPQTPVAFYPSLYSSHPPSPIKEHESLFRHPPAAKHAHEESTGKEEKKEEKGGQYVVSPLVGTFYTAASPEDPPFVKIGDQVTENTVICIIEAMKVMNEVKAGINGTVAEILVDNAHPVEFGTRLIQIV